MFYKNAWCGSKKAPAIKIEDDEHVAKDKIWHGSGITNERKWRHRNESCYSTI